jgi:hypothetical protein
MFLQEMQMHSSKLLKLCALASVSVPLYYKKYIFIVVKYIWQNAEKGFARGKVAYAACVYALNQAAILQTFLHLGNNNNTTINKTEN